MSESRPKPTAGLRHVALFVEQFEETVIFYTKLLGLADTMCTGAPVSVSMASR